jgi:hypothetical protein
MSFRGDGMLLKCAMAVDFFGCLRPGELCIPDTQAFDSSKHLCLGDVKFLDDEKMFSLHLKQSKTDKFSQGVDVYIGCSSHAVCAYCHLKEFLKLRVDDNPLSPLLSSMSVRVLRKAYFVNATRLALSSVGLDPSLYSGHSFRAGSATSGADSGFDHWELKMLGRWSSECFNIYI